MSRYQFRSPGADAGSAIEAFLVRQAMAERQRMLDEAAQQKRATETRQRDEQLALTRRAQDLADAQRTDAQDALNQEREFRRASTVADTMLPGVVDADTAGLLQKQGFGGLVQHVDVPGTPGVMDTAGGFKYQQARAAEQARSEQATQAQQAATERAAADRASRESIAAEGNATRQAIATLTAQNAGATRALQNELTQTKIDAEKQKQADAAAAQANARSSEEDTARQILGELDRLTTKNAKGDYELTGGAKSISGGLRVPGFLADAGLNIGGASDANAALKRLQSLLDVNTLRQLKSQSKTGATGLAALSQRELAVLESAAAALQTSQSESEFLQRLNDIRGATSKFGAPALTGGGTVAMVAPDGRPLNVPAEKVAELEAMGAKRR